MGPRSEASWMDPYRYRLNVAAFATLTAVCGIVGAATASTPAGAPGQKPAAHRPGVVLVGFEPGTPPARRDAVQSRISAASRSRTLVSSRRLAQADRPLTRLGPIVRLSVPIGS